MVFRWFFYRFEIKYKKAPLTGIPYLKEKQKVINIEEPMGLKISGEKLRTARLARLLTIAELAELVDMNPTHLSAIERGEIPTSRVKTVRKLSRALDVDPSRIILDARGTLEGTDE